MELCIKPGATMSWKDFTETQRPYSIALDGFVLEGPRFNPQGPWINFNHSEGVSRLETRSTSAQVLVQLRMGLMDTFDPDHTAIYLNGCDEDACLAAYLFRNYVQVNLYSNNRLNRLISMEDAFDTTGGAYSFAESLASSSQFLWVFEPFHRFRVSGKLYEQDAKAFRGVIDEVGERISRHVAGNSGGIKPDLEFAVFDRYDDIVMVREIGAHARLGVYESGIPFFTTVRELPGERYTYSLARSSPFVPFPIPRLVRALNSAELHTRLSNGVPPLGNTGGWGGSDMIAESPRDGSVLLPDSVMRLIHENR